MLRWIFPFLRSPSAPNFIKVGNLLALFIWVPRTNINNSMALGRFHLWKINKKKNINFDIELERILFFRNIQNSQRGMSQDK